MKKNEIIIDGELTGTIGEKSNHNQSQQATKAAEQEFDAIQQTWSVNPIDEQEYDGIIGYKDS